MIENPGKNIKCYSLEKNTGKNVLQGVDPIFLEIANEIIRYAEKEFGDIDTKIFYLLQIILHSLSIVLRMIWSSLTL